MTEALQPSPVRDRSAVRRPHLETLMKHYQTILTETTGEHLLQVTLNRPELGNAQNTQMGLDLLDLWTGLIDDPGEIRCVLLTGAGDRIFCAGDLKHLNPKQW